MKILITGAKGQLGSEIIKCLSEQKTELGSIPKALFNANYRGIDIDELDISDFEKVDSFISKEKFDVIINCAAYTDVNGCETNKDLAFKVNALGVRNLAISAENAGAKLLHISTDYVFSGEANKPYIEWEIPAPQSVYAFSKYLSEQYATAFCSRHFIVRSAWCYGFSGSNFVKTIIKNAKEKGTLKVVSDQRGNPTNAADLAHHLLKLCVTNEYGIYHGTGNGECSWFEFAQKIVKFANINAEILPCSTEEFPTPAKRPAYSSLDNMMLRNTVGDEFRNWEVALESFIKSWKEG